MQVLREASPMVQTRGTHHRIALGPDGLRLDSCREPLRRVAFLQQVHMRSCVSPIQAKIAVVIIMIEIVIANGCSPRPSGFFLNKPIIWCNFCISSAVATIKGVV